MSIAIVNCPSAVPVPNVRGTRDLRVRHAWLPHAPCDVSMLRIVECLQERRKQTSVRTLIPTYQLKLVTALRLRKLRSSHKIQTVAPPAVNVLSQRSKTLSPGAFF